MRALTLSLAAVAASAAFATSAAAAAPSFAPYVSYATGSGAGPGPAPVTTVAADFTGDGHPDVVSAANFGQSNVILEPNRANGTFGAPISIPGSSGIQALATADFDGDGRPDLVGMTGNSVVVLLNTGGGAFRVAGSYPETIGAQAEVATADLNHDGHPDIVALTFTGVQTLLGAGDGTFRSGPATTVPGAYALSGLTPANLDGDALPDLYVVDGSSGTIYALRGTGTGAFTMSGSVRGSGFVPEDIKAIDLNGDGIDDVAAIDSFSFTLATALADGHGGFASGMTSVDQYSGSGPTSLGVADFNHDGRLDIVVSNLAYPGDSELHFFTGNGTVKPTASTVADVAPYSQNPAIADFDGDGKPDVAAAGPGTLSILLNTTP